MGKRVALYARYSSDNQRVESIAAQLRVGREYCERKGYEILHEYVDEALTGTNDNREGFQQMVSDAKTGMYDTIVYHKIDRNARNEFDYYFYKRELKKAGVSFEYSGQNIDDSPEGQAMEGMLVIFAAHFSRNLSREVKKGLWENAYNGHHTGGKPPLGYDVGPSKKLVINEKEAPAVRLIFSMRADGSGYLPIINALNESGFKTKRGKAFAKNSLHEILINRKYIGIYTFGQRENGPTNKCNSHKVSDKMIEIPDAIPAIIDMDTWNRVQARIAADRLIGAQHLAKEEYLLTGLIRCECGSPMNGSRTKDYSYYKCSGQHNGSACDGRRIKKSEAEQIVLDELTIQLSSEGAAVMIQKVNAAIFAHAKETKAELETLDKEKSVAEKNIDKTMQLYYDDIIPKEEVGRIVAEKRDRIKFIDERLKEIKVIVKSIYLDEEQVRATFQQFAENLKNKTRQKEICRALIEKIVVTDTNVIIHMWLGSEIWRTNGSPKGN